MLTEEEQRYMQQLQEELDLAKQQDTNKNRQLSEMSMFGEVNNPNLIQFQLDLSEDKDKVYHLLKGDKLEADDEGNVLWVSAKTPLLKTLTEYGVDVLMQVIEFYLSRNTLLSNYEEEVINWKMKDLSDEIADKIFLEYEYIFHYPTRHEVLSFHKEVIKLKYDLRKYQHYPTLYAQKKEELIKRIDEIRDDIYKKNLKSFPMVCRVLVDIVHSAYLRAYNGGERDSLRTARHVSQSINPMGGISPAFRSSQNYQSQNKFKLWSPKTWAKSY